MSIDKRHDATGERGLIQVHRTERATVVEAIDLGICTAKVVQQDRGWVARCYTGPDEYRSEAPRPSRTDADDAAVRHTLSSSRSPSEVRGLPPAPRTGG